jgi:D-alanyl-D-alanine carboxypeptidase
MAWLKTVFLILVLTICGACRQNNPANTRKDQLETDIRNLMLDFTEEVDIPGMGFGYYSDTVGTVMVAVGKSDMEHDVPLTVNTHYPIQSTSKMFISILTLQLIEENRLSLESTIDTWTVDVPNSKQIAIRNLLNHTSGLSGYFENNEFMDAYYSDTVRKYSRNDLIRAGLELPYSAEDFGKFKYSNTNYLLLANIIESITGQSIGQVLEQRIFNPAGMDETYYKPDLPADTTSILTCYRNGEAVDLERANFASNAAGGIISTLGDMFNFAHWVMENGYENRMTSDLIFNFAVEDITFSAGLGIEVIDSLYSTELMGHSGGNPGLISEFYFSVETGEIFIFFINEGNPRVNYPLRGKLDSILQSYR